ncbi:SGNH/GDSL hydrolase family protein [Alkalicoccus daliensis]|uniref:SGNH/GDSL hydrolase family protein n=1 Tax=Alkalicoccus daliensis TaxID=745820 RepID=A0A1H0GH90_9BACI|nr:SGNH/GDSL hydrolase family protein [Alkalicoccus daliensis]SDO06218.1 hypothetical protein SAMN04488053_106107 [Alkalicoccus daliensis]
MRKYGVFVVIAAALMIIIAGRMYYSEKLASTAESAQQELAASQSAGTEDTEENAEEEVMEEPEIEEEQEVSGEALFTADELEELTADIPAEIGERITERLSSDEAVSVLTVGSRSSADYYNEGVTPWPELLEESLNEAYGEGVFTFNNVSFGEYTSEEIVSQNRHRGLADTTADILLLEGFNWNDNLAVVTGEDAQENILAIIDTASSENEDLITAIQPSPPAFETSIYPEQIEKFEQFVEDEGFIYIDHWEAWPGIDEAELLEYVTEERMPNQSGHELWSNYLIQSFVTQ